MFLLFAWFQCLFQFCSGNLLSNGFCTAGLSVRKLSVGLLYYDFSAYNSSIEHLSFSTVFGRNGGVETRCFYLLSHSLHLASINWLITFRSFSGLRLVFLL